MTTTTMTTKATLATPPLHVLRGIYRLLKTPELPHDLQKKAPPLVRPSPIQNMLLRRYRESAQAQGRDALLLRTLAVQYYNLQLDLRERDILYKLDTGAEEMLSPKEFSQRAAARAGLELPQQYQEDEVDAKIK